MDRIRDLGLGKHWQPIIARVENQHRTLYRYLSDRGVADYLTKDWPHEIPGYGVVLNYARTSKRGLHHRVCHGLFALHRLIGPYEPPPLGPKVPRDMRERISSEAGTLIAHEGVSIPRWPPRAIDRQGTPFDAKRDYGWQDLSEYLSTVPVMLRAEREMASGVSEHWKHQQEHLARVLDGAQCAPPMRPDLPLFYLSKAWMPPIDTPRLLGSSSGGSGGAAGYREMAPHLAVVRDTMLAAYIDDVSELTGTQPPRWVRDSAYRSNAEHLRATFHAVSGSGFDADRETVRAWARSLGLSGWDE
ncbi:MAG: hypothetical protein HY369_03705 [Candidatus Aenigmarchaeota archaeon]|nr:hypothetical protein [Candidatus Aenigmarchaeota archaeon]